MSHATQDITGNPAPLGLLAFGMTTILLNLHNIGLFPSTIMGLSPKGVGIKSFKSRWGSCSVKGKLDFNWKIVMAPNRIVDYVVVHELCHLKQHDHSPKFWALVERVVPDYLACKEWLKLNAETLQI